jgi:hypothetical protein
LERSAVNTGYDPDQLTPEIFDSKLLKETFDPHGVEGFSHIQENHTAWRPLVKVSLPTEASITFFVIFHND